jgi:hypothetical protein
MTSTQQLPPTMRHTPGPWHVEPLQADRGASIAICNGERRVLAVIPPLNPGDDPSSGTAQRHPHDRANAALIATAPELLAEAKWLVEAVFSTGISEAEAHRITMSARAAIAKVIAAESAQPRPSTP